MTTSAPSSNALIIVVMGVSGCGKTTIASLLGGKISAHVKDGDELHPDSNIKKMAGGIPLNDDDRLPWLRDVASYAKIHAHKHGICVIACSALKREYRKILNEAGNVVYVFLHGSKELIASRMLSRRGHFMPETLLSSQFDALDDPRSETNVLTVDIESDPDTIASSAATALQNHAYLVAAAPLSR